MDYFNESSLAVTADPYKYWKENAEAMEILSTLAQKYLSGPLGSVESERLFSIAGELIEESRTRLSKEKVEMLLYLHHNLVMLNFEY